MEVGEPGEVRSSPTRGKEILMFTCSPGDAGCHVQNAITWSLSMHINKELSFVLMKLLFALMSLLQEKL